MKGLIKATLRPVWAPIRRRFEHIARVHQAPLLEEAATLRARLGACERRLEEVISTHNHRLDGLVESEADLRKLLTELTDKVKAVAPNLFYEEQIARELANFNEVTNVHDLPEIFHYWSNRYLLPMFRECGFGGIDEFYASHFVKAARRVGGHARFVSVGAGNCDTEIRVAKLMMEMGLRDFELECLELNPVMLERGRDEAVSAGLERVLRFTQADFKAWRPSGSYAGVMANHSLHHVTNLEGLFDGIKRALDPRGYFVTSDMIGRNGHQRWPEALEHVQQLWEELPQERRYNHLLRRSEPQFINWDCSGEGFEGIRAQDILPLLLERFDFEVFVGFSNVVSPFVDRCFGHNFDAGSARDRAFIDRVHQIDEEGFATGKLKPTQMLAVMTVGPAESHLYARGLSPQTSVRTP
ncbi:class I SAM-dependent methyltransferase [Variovorax sp. J22P271]|uniref:class I SAM-dependent methyltransferase n=1 Tax=Variovorax davisae TaxID=3053515 RepID=UPI002577BA03|nr:class I SAM-dependent methyltransferase [Variovorax sp. J22P271]MDM0032096.1 class I SAM-dependent methyltransferase [Variovorax sp. J22P271]